MFKTPILFIIFNRLDTTNTVFEEIRKIKPKQLFIAADGPRENIIDEIHICELTRNIVIENIDWECEVKTLFRNENLGCGKAVSGAISWFFENVEEGIILEDDCLPHESFFLYCETMLNRYRLVENIGIITGNNFQNGIQRGDGSYYYSKYSHIWGWATWKSTWALYDFEMKEWQNFKSNLLLSSCNNNMIEFNYWKEIFEMVYLRKINTWDYQLLFSMWFNNLITICPNVNLISNIGFGESATHTTDRNSKLSNLEFFKYEDDKIPSKIEIDRLADDYTFNSIFQLTIVEEFNVENRKNNNLSVRDKLYLLRQRILSKFF